MYHFIKFTAEQVKPEFYIWLGDNTPHDIWNLNITEHMDPGKITTDWFTKEFNYGGIGKVYPVVGNHEGMPSDHYNVYGNEHNWIFNNLTTMWGEPWFTTECNLFN